MRGEEVASSIDAHVREAVERMVGEIRTSIEDIRTAVDSQLKAALQSVQADVNSFTFLPHIQKTIGELEETIQAEQPAPVAAAPSGGDVSRLKQAVQAVERGKSQVDILNALLEQCLDFGSRAALLILRGETFSGWKGVGFSAHGGNDENIKRFNAAPGLISELDHVLRNERVVAWDGANLATRFGVGAPQQALLIPMVIKDKVAAAVYVDATAEDASKLDQSSVELLVFTTGLLIDTLAIRKKSPSPSLSEGEGAAAAPAQMPPQTPTQTGAQTGMSALHSPAAPAPKPAAEEQGSATVAITAQQMREMMAAAAPAPPRPAVAPAPPPPPPPPVAPPAPSFTDEGRPTTQFIPPAGVSGRAAAIAAQSEDAKKHDEARRFARLLVSEIKLYNEAKVEVGRKNKDLYERLKEDIDRSRQMYDERIGEDVRKSSNYFYDELVRILANGNAEVLGL
ncbi:MAG TPA: hypothetical protein VH087_02270 [Thermoanaerobaculia bacterium]|nr:hypothetical protein [Thermoanaerobaculia bacterium]